MRKGKIKKFISAQKSKKEVEIFMYTKGLDCQEENALVKKIGRAIRNSPTEKVSYSIVILSSKRI